MPQWTKVRVLTIITVSAAVLTILNHWYLGDPSQLIDVKNRPKPTKTWTKPEDNPEYFKRRSWRVTPLDFDFTISSTACKNGSPDLIILVLSLAGNRHYRDAIRDTWGSVSTNNTWAGIHLPKTVKLVFLFGKTGDVTLDSALKREADEKSDIVQADFKESYFNLTYKVLLGIKWVKENCHDVKHIMKNDEDSFVNIPMLLERLRLPEWNSRIIGPFFSNQIRYTLGKYFVNPERYPFAYYPKHVKGNIYVMPAETAFSILECAQYMPYVNMEDAHITGILARTIGATHQAIAHYEYQHIGQINVCDVAQRKKLAARAISPGTARLIWSNVLNPKWCKLKQSRLP